MPKAEKGRRFLRAVAGAVAVGVTAALAACGGDPAMPPAERVHVKLIAFNDLHGNLEAPGIAVSAPAHGGGSVRVPAGGAAYLATAIATLKARNPNHAVVSAGDMIGASPLVSALFLDEPTIGAVNRIGIDFNAVGNHEFDKGQQELLRMQHGGCARYTALTPCQVDPSFPGANFGFLAANTVKADGTTLFPATGLKRFTQGGATVTVGFIGMTLKGTPTMVSPSGVAGLRFMDEAETANALVPALKAQGADAIVVVVHEGGTTRSGYDDKRCEGLSGDIVPILARLDPAIDVVVSGHTHRAYVCDYRRTEAARPLLLTSAGLYGTLLTDIDLAIDTRTRKVVARSANNLIVQGEAFGSGAAAVPLTDAYPRFAADEGIAELIARHRRLAAPLVQRVVGRLSAPATRASGSSREHVLGNLIADSQLAATRTPAQGGARIALMNPGGVRTDLLPAADGTVTYGQLFSTQPFGNSLVVKTLTGAQIGAALEQQFDSGSNTIDAPRVLLVSRGFSYAYDLRRPAGARIADMRLDGVPIDAAARYRVTMNSYLAAGGDNFSVLAQGSEAVGGGQDIDAMERYIRERSPLAPPAVGRIRNLAPLLNEPR